MSHNRPPLPVIILVIIIVLGTAGYFGWQQIQGRTQGTGPLSASGTVETVEIAIAPEFAGKVQEVLVDEGDSVRAGDVLFRLDSSLLEAQKNLAAANLDTAKSAATTAESAVATARSQYDQAVITALNEETALRIADWKETEPSDYDYPSWYFDREEKKKAFEAEVSAAQEALKKAQDDLNFYVEKATSGDFLAAEKRLNEARAAYEIADQVLDSTSSTDQEIRDAAQTKFDDAQTELEDAQKAYDDTLTSEGADDILTARAELRVAQERADKVADKLRALQTGLSAPKVLAAQKSVEQAETAAKQAQTAISQAEANLALINAQLAKLVITAPADGVVLSRNVQPGEVVNPGAIVIILGRLDELTITVYIPEDRYGLISLEQKADVKVDSFADQTFEASVIHIADQAEFTPRNVQTSDGRKTTVFAIKLQLANPDGKLKPGMPADVVFK